MAQFMDINDKPYAGKETIVVAIDLGTTQSAVSFAHLYPGQKVNVRMVTKWAGQPENRGDAKIPSLVAYVDGTPLAFGAETREYTANENCEFARWFKLHLHPRTMAPSSGSNFEIPPLPPQVTLLKVYADFLHYLIQATRNFFEANTPNGLGIWNRLQSGIVIVLATPNGWDTTQHTLLRQAVIMAGLVSEETADELLEFVTESEASVHYAIARTQSQTWLKPDSMFVVCDAGGSTVDSVLYECTMVASRLTLKEVCASECIQAGGVFVDRAMETLLQNKLRDSRFGEEDIIGDMVESFERKTKRTFDGSQDSSVLDFGGRRDNDRAYGILQGKISLNKDEVTSCFEGVTQRIVDSCLSLLRGRKIKYLLLVGGFGDAPYLQNSIKDIFNDWGTEVVIVDEPSKKAAAEGAALWFVVQLVVARAARFTVGAPYRIPYQINDPEHRERRTGITVDVDGCSRVPGAYKVLVKKNFVMDQAFRATFSLINLFSTKPTQLSDHSSVIEAWEGEGDIKWTTDRYGTLDPLFRPLCTIKTDLSQLIHSLRPIQRKNGGKYWQINYDIVISFGGTKLRAYLEWVDQGITKQGRASIIANALL